MHRSVLALLFAAVLLLGGCAAGQQTVPKEKSGQETNRDGAAVDRSDEEFFRAEAQIRAASSRGCEGSLSVRQESPDRSGALSGRRGSGFRNDGLLSGS